MGAEVWIGIEGVDGEWVPNNGRSQSVKQKAGFRIEYVDISARVMFLAH